MAARDKFHNAVKSALVKSGWKITADPMNISFGGVDQQIDLAAENVFAAERGEEKIAVEIKSFLGASAISDFHTASGQYRNYQRVLRRREPDRLLFLAVPKDAYRAFFQLEFAQVAIGR